MKLQISRDLLQAACKIVIPAASARPLNPVLSFMRIIAEGGWLHLTCTDGELEIQHRVAIDTPHEGTILVPAAHFSSVVSKLPKADVLLEAEGNMLRVECGRSKVALPLHPDPGVFPNAVAVTGGARLVTSCGEMARLMILSGYCAAPGDGSAWRHWACLEMRGGALTGVTVDSGAAVMYRLFGLECPDFQWTLQPKAFSLLEKLVNAADDKTELTIMGDTRMMARFGNTIALLPLGTLPFTKEYEKLSAAEISTSFTVDTVGLREAVSRLESARAWQTAVNNIVSIDANGEVVSLTVNHGEHGTADEEVSGNCSGQLQLQTDTGSLLKAISPITEGYLTIGTPEGSPFVVVTSSAFPDWKAIVSVIH